MAPTWTVLLLVLLGSALTGPFIDPPSRMMAAVGAVGLAFAGRPGWGLLLGALLLGAVTGHRQWGPSVAPATGEQEVVAAWTVQDRLSERTVRAWLRWEGQGPTRVQLSGLPPEIGPGARGFAAVRVVPLRARRNPDDRNALRAARGRGIVARAYVRGDPRIVDAGQRSPAERARSAAVGAWSEGLPAPTRALWRALLLGDRSELPRAASERLRRLGLAHLLALSGLHVGIVAGLLLLPLRAWGRRGLGALLPLLALWAVVAGAGPSLLRAVGMLTWWVGARRGGRPAEPLTGLAVVALVDLVLRPASSLGVGWWLSYAATASILRVLPVVGRWGRVRAGLGISFAAQGATAPWILGVFGALAPAAAPGLLVLGPLFALVLALGVAVLGVALVLPVPECLLRLVALASHGFGAATALVEKLSPAPWGHPGFGGVWWAMALAAVALLLPPWRRGARLRWASAALLVAIPHASLVGSESARWISLDVGQGDAGVLRAGSRALVVDAGPRTPGWDAGARVVLPYLRRRNLSEVGLALTHGHLDHTGGAGALLRSGVVGRLYVARADSGRAWTKELRAMAAEHGATLRWLERGDRLRVGGLVLRCLWPPGRTEHEDANDRSLVLSFSRAGHPLLLTGDLERPAERQLLDLEGEGLERATILKVAHHGGDTGTDAPWLRRLRPRWALLSCGTRNRYGHPHPALLERLRRFDVRHLRTDVDGAIEVRWTANDPPVVRLRTVTGGFLDDR